MWATRSPFRPNNLGLSSVRIRRVLMDESAIEVQGADLMDGTPIYDVKPYLPYVDSHAEARGGFTDQHAWQRLEVSLPASVQHDFSDGDLAVLRELLALDPRPHYHDDEQREYGMPFMGYDVRFRVADDAFTYFGKGPVENYSDRASGASKRIWKSSPHTSRPAKVTS